MNTSKRHRTACVFTSCARTVWRKYKRSGGHHHRMRFCLSSKLSREGCSDNLSKRRPSRLSRSGFIGFSSENDPTCWEKTSPKNECLENACLFWLPMLHYEHSWLNGWGCPFGIETMALICSKAASARLNGWGCPWEFEAVMSRRPQTISKG